MQRALVAPVLADQRAHAVEVAVLERGADLLGERAHPREGVDHARLAIGIRAQDFRDVAAGDARFARVQQ